MSKFGIDLGTTNSCLARYDEQRKCAVVITNNAESAQTMASVVAFDPLTPGIASVGKSAKAIIEDAPERGIEFVKRSMGSDDVVLSLDGTDFRPQDISTFILKQIKAYGEDSTGEEVKEVVVTVPAYFGYAEREATRKAALAAGFDLKALIDEPTAAALSYFENYFSPDPLTVFVYDLGGGTFDVSAVKMTFQEDGTQRIEVLTFDGNHRLGGMDWDNELYNLVIEKVEAEMKQQNPSTVLSDQEKNSIRNKIEELKFRLTNAPVAPFRTTTSCGRINVQMTREDFEARTSYLLEQTKVLCKGVLAHRKMEGVKVDRVLLVGGSSMMPMVHTMVESIFPGTEILLADPNQSVAKGACIACYMGLGDSTIYDEDNPPFCSGEDGPKGSGTGERPSEPGKSEPPSPPVIPVVPKSVGFRLYDAVTNTRYIDTRVFRGERLTDNGHLLITIDDYGPVRDNMPRVVVAAFELNNDDVNVRRVDVDWADDTLQTVNENNNPYGIRYLGELELPLEPGTPAHAHLRLLIDVSSTGLRMECYNVDTNGEHRDVTLNIVSDVNTAAIQGYGLEG